MLKAIFSGILNPTEGGCHETEAVFGGTDCLCVEAGRERDDNRGDLPEDGRARLADDDVFICDIAVIPHIMIRRHKGCWLDFFQIIGSIWLSFCSKEAPDKNELAKSILSFP